MPKVLVNDDLVLSVRQIMQRKRYASRYSHNRTTERPHYQTLNELRRDADVLCYDEKKYRL